MGSSVQQTVQGRMAPAIEGAWASTNPRDFYVAGPGGLVAGSAGLTVGRFAWTSYQAVDWDEAPAFANNFGAGNVSGFVPFNMQAQITTYPSVANAVSAGSSMLIQPGYEVELAVGGDFWVQNYGSNYVSRGMFCFATLANGQPTFASANTATVVTAATSSVAAVTSTTFTGSIVDNVLTVAAPSATIYIGMTIAGTNVASGSIITGQLTGTAGSAGTYTLNIGNQTIAAEAMTTTYGVLTLGATPSGAFQVGALLTGTGISVPTYITQVKTGTGAVNGDTLIVNVQTGVSSTTLSATTNVLTPWYALSGGAAGQLVKIGKSLSGLS